MRLRCVLLGAVLSAVSVTALADARNRTSYSPHVGAPAPDQVFWGDTHLHTSLSVDAYAFGNRALGPEEAYRFAKGEVVTGFNGMAVRLRRPLDFLVIADHAENLGLLPELDRGAATSLIPEKAKSWTERFAAAWAGVKGDPVRSTRLWQAISAAGFTEGNVLTEQARSSIWQRLVKLADAENVPGRFTAFIGYEWTQWNEWLHRVVIYRDDARRAAQMRPFTAFDSSDPEDLWAWMEEYERRTGGQVLAIPHNSNLTSGSMFALQTARGAALTADYARTRQRWEPLLEVTQSKGDSETHPQLSPQDAFADFERMSMPRRAPQRRTEQSSSGTVPFSGWYERFAAEPTTAWMRQFEYARSGLMLGLDQQARLGANPFKYGMAGGSDAHTGLATTDEDNFWGASSSFSGPHPQRIAGPWLPNSVTAGSSRGAPGQVGWTMSAAGLTAVWAEANTREALFAALKRRETYATTGPRIIVRFFGGWTFERADADHADIAALGYRKGVPMGADLAEGPTGGAPTFLIRASRDPLGANLDRAQIVKGWRRPNGALHERVYDVALSDERRPSSRGQISPVGNTVDVAKARYSNSIGDPELSVVWRDPDFDPTELAFYYVRVIEIPTPKWTAFDAKFFGIQDLPSDVPMTTQERAYTSPIWYTPPAR